MFPSVMKAGRPTVLPSADEITDCVMIIVPEYPQLARLVGTTIASILRTVPDADMEQIIQQTMRNFCARMHTETRSTVMAKTERIVSVVSALIARKQ